MLPNVGPGVFEFDQTDAIGVFANQTGDQGLVVHHRRHALHFGGDAVIGGVQGTNS